MMMGTRAGLAIVGVVAAVLQLVLAPAIAIAGYTPNFMIAATLVVLALEGENAHYAFAFVMGLVADLVTGYPIGSTSVALLACAFLIPYAVNSIGNDTIVMSVFLMLGATLVCLLVSGILLSVAGLMGPIDAFVYYILPGTVYNGILAVVLHLLASHSAAPRAPRSGNTMTNVRFN